MPDKSCRKFPDKFVWGFLILSGSLLSGSIVFFTNFDRFLGFSNTGLGLANAESKSAVRGFVDSNINYRDKKVSQVLDAPPMESSESNNSEADIYVSPFGSDNQVERNVTATNAEVVFVADKGSDNNPGSQKSPYRSLTRAIKQAIRIQDGNKNKPVSIKLDAGTYSFNSGETSPVDIPQGVSVVGSGDTTIIKADIRVYYNSHLENLKIINSQLKIGNSADQENTNVNIKKVTISGGVDIYSSPKISNLKVFSQVSTAVYIRSGTKPQLENVEIYNQQLMGNPDSGAIYINKRASPIFNNLKINRSSIGINNSGNASLINLEISQNRIGIINRGELTINNLVASNNTHTAICNKGTILIEGAKFDNNPPKTRGECPNVVGESPIVVPDIAGNSEGVTIR
jgi:hypothetical protein